ncbi:hypothetical protein C4B60_20415 [Jeotgalibacillus proteolyticus]|uniref:Uncharacterized protein n=1 Tax=Jeotgalibacillus proteolyticus TaxID=2082395 RepID=A0A2S5G6D2_9BACL|nr:hypothetical protein C4B60_20415 [Jeotgalibacillus proteolyticus]
MNRYKPKTNGNFSVGFFVQGTAVVGAKLLPLFLIQFQQAAPRIVSCSSVQAKSACLADPLTSVGAKRLLPLFLMSSSSRQLLGS